MELFGLQTEASATAIVTTLLVGGLLLWLLNLAQTSGRGVSGIPGPVGYPFFGNHFALVGPKRHATLRSWADKYGGVFKVHGIWGSSPFVVVSDPEVAKAVLCDLNIPKYNQKYNSVNEMLHGQRLPSMYTSPTAGPYWKAVRKCVVHAFSAAEVEEDFEVAKLKTLVLAEQLMEQGSGVSTDMHAAALRLSLDVLGLSKFGYDFHATEGKGTALMVKLLKECSVEWAARQANPLRRWLWWAVDSWATSRKKFQILQAFFQEMLATVVKRGPPPDDDITLAAQLVRLRDPLTAKMMDPQHLLAELGSFIVAGYESTAHALSWALVCLAACPEAQRQLWEELEKAGVPSNPQRVGWQKISQLPFLDAVLRESLRLYPTGAMDGSTRQVKSKNGVQIGPHHFPCGTVILVNSYAMHRSSRNWLLPDRFFPERWMSQGASEGSGTTTKGGASVGRPVRDGLCTAQDLPVYQTVNTRPPGGGGKEAESNTAGKSKGGGGKEAVSDTAGKSKSMETSNSVSATADDEDAVSGPQLCNRRAYLPFSAGARACVGQGMAVAELKAMLAMLISFFSFEPAGGELASLNGGQVSDSAEEAGGSDNLYNEYTVGLSLCTKAGVPLLVTPRFQET